MSVAYRSTCWPTIGQPLLVDILTDISVECQSTYRPMLDRYVGRDIEQHISVDITTDTPPICWPNIDQHLADMSTDTSFDCQSICRPICRLGGAQNTHDPNLLEQRLCYVVSLKPKNMLYTCYTCTVVINLSHEKLVIDFQQSFTKNQVQHLKSKVGFTLMVQIILCEFRFGSIGELNQTQIHWIGCFHTRDW